MQNKLKILVTTCQLIMGSILWWVYHRQRPAPSPLNAPHPHPTPAPRNSWT